MLYPGPEKAQATSPRERQHRIKGNSKKPSSQEVRKKHYKIIHRKDFTCLESN